MTYTDSATDYARASQGDVEAASRLPLSEWADRLRRASIPTPQTTAANHALNVRGCAHDLRSALRIQAQSDRERMVTPDEAAQMVSECARALLDAIGEGQGV